MSGTVLELEVPVPAAKKNRQRILKRHGRLMVSPSEQAVADEEHIRLLVQQRLRGVRGALFGDDDVGVGMVYLPRREVVQVAVQSIGPRPKGFAGRRRDLPNLSEVILDAMQRDRRDPAARCVFVNDNQVAELTMIRDLS